MSGGFRYAAFVSYSSKDAAFAQRLHRALEAYAVPKSLGEFDLLGDGSGKKNRIYPVFRDREELAAGHLAERIEASLAASAALIVVCSPNAAASPWVEKEIEYFVAHGRADRVFAIIADTAPVFDETGADATLSCFPPAFRVDALSGGKLEPLAADARKGKDGFRNAYLKVVSGLVGVTPGQLIDRDRQRRGRQRLMIAGGAAAGALGLTIPLVWQDTAGWRSTLTQRADQLRAAGDQSGAMALALAGSNLGGALIPARAANADTLVRDLAGLTLLMRASPEDSLAFSEDGKTVQAFAKDGTVTIFDLDGKKSPRVIGKADRSLGGPQGTWPFSARFPYDKEGWVIPEGYDAEIIRLPVLNLSRWTLVGSKPGVTDPKATGQKLASVLPGFDRIRFANEFAEEEDGTFFHLMGLSSEAKARVEALGLAGIELQSSSDTEFPKRGGSELRENGVVSRWLAFPDADGVLHVFDVGEGRGQPRTIKFAEPVANLWFAKDKALVQGRSGALFAFDVRSGETAALGSFAPVKRIVKQLGGVFLLATTNDDLVLATVDAKMGKVEAKTIAKLDPHAGDLDDSATWVIVKLADGNFAAFDMARDNVLVRLGKYRQIEVAFNGPDEDTLVGKDVDSGQVFYFDLATGKGGPFATIPGGHIHFAGGGGTTAFTARSDPETYENGPVTWYSLDKGVATLRGIIGDNLDDSADGRRVLGWSKRGDIAVYEVASGKPIGRFSLPDIKRVQFAGDTPYVVQTSGRILRLDLASGKALPIGDIGAEAAERDEGLVHDGERWMAITGTDGGVTVVDVTGKTPDQRFPPKPGAKIETFGYVGTTITYVAADGSREVHWIGGKPANLDPRLFAFVTRASPETFSNSVGPLRAEQSKAGQLTIYNEVETKVVTDFGKLPMLASLTLTADGKTVAGRDEAGVIWLVDTAAPEKRRNLNEEFPGTPVGNREGSNSTSLFTLAKDGKAMVVRGGKGELTLLNLRGRASAISIGTESGGGAHYQFVGDGSRIMLGRTRDERAIYDLAASADIVAREGGDLANAVCQRDGDSLAPFDASARSADPRQTGSDKAAYDALKGRPWNPCDWRGLFAILPDDSGGGWFEGPRQWLRLVGVRMGWAADYGCEETVSGADAARAERRREACLAAQPMPPSPSR